MVRPLVDVKDLQYFLAVYELQGFSKAAKRLRTVQSNVSARIGTLERHLGVALFERRYRQVTPTRGGIKLYNAAKRVLAAFHTLERKARAWRRLSYTKNR
jgi:DNA-binding transcriptional LysR family regulator